MRARSLAVSVLAGLVGCTAAPTEVVVLVDAEPPLPAADHVVVRVLGDDGSIRLEEPRPTTGLSWPLRVPVVPVGGDARRGWIVEAELVDASGATISTARAHGGYVAGEIREALVCLSSGCGSLACTPCATASSACTSCARGVCIDATAMLVARGTTPRCPGACDTGACSADAGPVDAFVGDTGACVPSAENTLAACHDGTDDDCDGLADCTEGPDCVFPESASAGDCDDGLDDDCDGMIDCAEASCAGAPCAGGGGHRCCNGVCVDTWSNELNCGACGIACATGRICAHVPDATGTGFVGGACRCSTAGECRGGSTCESHDGAMLCDCVGDADCAGAATCRHQGAVHHSWCSY